MNGHAAVAAELGVDDKLLDAALEDLETAEIDEKLKPILRFVKKLTQEPYRIVQRDADAVYEAGWSEMALSDAICVCAHFNMVNRLVDGHGVNLFELWHNREAMRELAAKSAGANYNDYVFDENDK